MTLKRYMPVVETHEQAHAHWANLVNAAGGLAAFSTGELPK